MARGIGVVELLAAVPDAAVLLAGLVTQLGDVWFLSLCALALAAAGRRGDSVAEAPRRDGLVLFALAVGAYSLTTVLKAVFALPRPPGAATAMGASWLPVALEGVYASLTTGHGYGFPSGHAVATTAVYGGAAGLLTLWTRTRRYAAAATLVAAVGTTRVLLGVHYAVDVVAGVVVGAALLLAVRRAAGHDPGRALGIATAIGVGAFAVAPRPRTALAVLTPAVALGVWVLGRD